MLSPGLAASLPVGAPPPMLTVSLGLIGVGLLWRAAAEHIGFPYLPGEAMVVAALAVYATIVTLYVVGLRRDAGALARDLARPAGRGAVPAATEGMILAGAALLPFAASAAPIVWSVGVFLHLFLLVRLLGLMTEMKPQDRAPSGFLVVPLCGLIVAPVGGAPMASEVALGASSVASLFFWISLGIYAALAPAAVSQLLTRPTRPEYRPGAYVLLAPPAVAVVGYDKLHPDGALTPLLFVIACMIVAIAWMKRDWLTEGGFAPTWACFTFPSAAFAGACLTMAGRSGTRLAEVMAGLAVLAATALTLYVARLCVVAWREGRMHPL